MFLVIIPTAFAMLLVETNKYILELIGRFNTCLVPPEQKCVNCQTDIENFDIQFPFCEDCGNEISNEIEPEYISPPEEKSPAYQ